MTPLEDKLRAAIHATAEEIPADPPPLRLASPALNPRRRPWFRPAASRFRPAASRFRPAASRFRPGRRGWNPWLAPLAAAVLVVAVVLGSLAVTRSGSGTATPSTPPGLAGLPPYYVALIALPADPASPADPADPATAPTVAQVRSTATGAVLATIAAPKPYVKFTAVTAAADDRTFVLDAQGASFSLDRQRQLHNHLGNVAQGTPYRLFVLHIDPDPKSHSSGVSLQALPASFIPAGQGIGNMALSPDGTSLAAASPDGSEHGYDMQLIVFNLVTGTRRIWGFKSADEIYMPPAMLGGLSWTADGQHIAFTGPGASAGSSVLRLLDTSDPGPNALAASKPIPTPAAITHTDEGLTTAIITPDGRTAVFATAVTTRDGQEMLVRRRILKVSVATGQVTAILGTPKSLAGKPLDFELILYSNATGSVLVVSYAQPGTSAWILHGDTYTRIPWSPHTFTAAW
jgi:dipeptidyl aminopeptidase/acylaminoacyl peptidase